MRVHVLFDLALVCLCITPGSAFSGPSGEAGDSTSTFRWFPADRLFPKLLADGTAEQMSLNKDAQTRRWIGSIGGIQRVAGWTAWGTSMQLGVGATVYASLIRKPEVLQVVTADFFVDFPLDIRFSERFALRTGWGHFSAHLVDDGIELLNLHSINYAKDYIPLLATVSLPDVGGMVYGGTRIDYYTIPERSHHWVLQGGCEAGNIAPCGGVWAYAAIDVKVKSEAGWGTTQSYQAGVKFAQHGSSALRIAYTYRTGLDDRGQFYANHIDVSLLGVFVDF